MERASGVKVSASAYQQHDTNQQYVTLHPVRWLWNGICKFVSMFGRSPQSPSCLPHHHTPCSTSQGLTSAQNPTQLEVLYLMACMNRSRNRKSLRQDRIEDVVNDKGMLCFMRQQYDRHRSRVLDRLGLKRVSGIFFVKFDLPLGGSVNVRHHDRCSTSCDCMPPIAKVEPPSTAEYKCSPIPPKTLPPIPPEYLAMLFHCPSETHKDDTWVLNQLPKRTCGLLQGTSGQPAQGWGIYYEEGWDRDLIILTVFVVFLSASLLFGVLWSKYHSDLQAAFGVSAWMATMGGILITLLVPQLEKVR
jgi:hypothetical protein